MCGKALQTFYPGALFHHSITSQCKLLGFVHMHQCMFTSIGGYTMFRTNTLGKHLDEWKAIVNDSHLMTGIWGTCPI